MYNDNKTGNKKIVNHVNDALIDLRNSVNKKGIPGSENPPEVINVVEKILESNKQQKGKGRPSDLDTCLKILIPKQILQRLPISLAQVKAGNTSENLLNESGKSYILCNISNHVLLDHYIL